VNVDEYELKHFSTYAAFADTVRFIVNQALVAASSLPSPQSIQARAKGIKSLRNRLIEAGKIDTQTLETERRDLAGIRLIFYTNNDVDRFLASSLIHDNFEVEQNSTRVHHPTPENEEAQYRAVHYTVRLNQHRVGLPEYARFAGLRCEIQIQTILNHAWSETSHDILYKHKLVEGYGGKAMQGIARRFERIMDEYLRPAGYEFQKAQKDFDRIVQGKELFDKDVVTLLGNAQNNNERYEILSGLKDYAIPHYDNLPAAYDGLKATLLSVVRAARGTQSVPIITPFGNLDGFKVEAVTKLVVEIINGLRYADVTGTLQLLIDIYQDEPSESIRQQVLGVVKGLSEYNIDAYNQVGPSLQMALVDHIAGLDNSVVDKIRPVALAVWSEAIQPDITGTKWKADSLELRTGALPASDQLKEVRAKAIKALFAAYDRSTNDVQRREILSALDAATRTPIQASYSNELMATTIQDATRIVDFVAERAVNMSFELRQHLEHRFLHDYRRAQGLTDDRDNRFACQVEAKALVSAILKFREIINADYRFFRYKILVGFESVYPDHWIDQEFDYNSAEKYRSREAESYLQSINTATEVEWFETIERCAETKSSNLATFPVFGHFISKLAETMPETAERFLAKASTDLRRFLAGFLNGLALSGRSDIYVRTLDAELDSAINLTGIMRHLRYSDVHKPDIADRLLKLAIDKGDSAAVIECFLFALENYGSEKVADAEVFLRDALTYLNDRKDSRWVAEAWFLQKATKFYEEITAERTAQILQNLGHVGKINFQVEQILVRLAERHAEAVWDYFGTRLAREGTEDEERFEAVPFRFHGLEKELSKNLRMAISKGLSWFKQNNSSLFQFRGGRLISNVFPNCTPEFAAALAESVRAGGDTEADFALAILKNYHGESSSHVVLKEILSRFPNDARKWSQVRSSIDSTGVVSGELGFAEAWRAKRESLKEWLTDERPAVQEFAERHISELDLRIASEHRRAESEMEMWKREYEDQDDNTGNGNKLER
jgi:ppGpp synthetase/RelA/SpoT-type nucleotidyltranferase